jgi:hypothetical protein
MRPLLAVVLLLVALGCGGSDGAPACGPPLDGACMRRTGTFCTEYAGLPAAGAAPIMTSCTRPDPDGANTWSPSGCSHANSIGACRQMQAGACVAVWLYGSSALAAEAQRQCAQQGGTWVSP